MKKISLTLLALFLLTACQKNVEESRTTNNEVTTMEMPAVMGSDVAEMVVDENTEEVSTENGNMEETSTESTSSSTNDTNSESTSEPTSTAPVISTPTPTPLTEAPLRVITISAERFAFSPSIIKVKQGEKVMIKVSNTDFGHNINVPQLGISDESEFMLDTSTKGQFTFSCANPCGSGHGSMKGTIIIE